jgi:uncharacterized membrane protein
LIPALIVVHVLCVVFWIGGVAFVTTVMFPMLQKMDSSFEQVMTFQRVEHRFARQVRLYLALVGLTGGLLLYLQGTHRLLFSTQGLGITLMLLAWMWYFLVLLFERRLFKALFGRPEKFDTRKVFRGLAIFHWVILGLSLLAVAVGVWQGHGGAL